MKKYRWLIAIVGVAALGFAVIFGAAFGAGITYFMLQADPVKAAFTAPVEVGNEEGVLISSIKPESAAANAGLVRGDIVLEIDGESVNSTLDLKALLAEYAPGDLVELTVLHGDETRTLEVALDDFDGFAFLGVGTCEFEQKAKAFPGGSMEDFIIEAAPLGAEILEVIPDSPADSAGLQVGDFIISVDENEIGFEADLADLIQKYEPGDEVTLWILKLGAKDEEVTTLNKSEVTVTLGEHPDKPGQAYLGVAYQFGSPMGGLEGGEFPFMEIMPFGEMPEGWEGEEGMPKFFFHHGDEFDGELPEGWEEDGKFFFHGVPGTPFQGEEGMPHFFDLGELPEGVDGAVIISEVMEDTPAAEAGLQPGDLIIAIDNEPVVEIEAFVEEMQSRKPGDEVALTIIRQGEENDVNVTLTEHPDDPEKGFLGVLAGTFMMMETMELPEGFDQNFEFEFPGVPGGDA